jgi:flagellar basal-body rod protein FlgB
VVSIIDNGTIAQVGMALDVTALRHQAISQNIANVNTPGYRPVTVGFARHFGALHAQAEHSTGHAHWSYPGLQLSGADSVSLDVEMAKLSENTLQQQVLLKVLSKQFALLGNAIAGGRR